MNSERTARKSISGCRDKLKDVISQKAKENLVTHTETGYQGLQNSAKAVDTREELAKTAKVSHDTIAKVEKIKENAPLPVVEAARRNLNDFQRSEIVHKCENAVKAKAKERQIRKPVSVMEKFPEQKEFVARDELGKMAGTSGKTYEHAVTVLEKASEPVVQATRQNDLTFLY